MKSFGLSSHMYCLFNSYLQFVFIALLLLISKHTAEDGISSDSSSSCRRVSEDDDDTNGLFDNKGKRSCDIAEEVKPQKLTELLVDNPIKFLKEHVFGQKESSITSSKEFLSMLDEDDAETTTTTTQQKTDNEPNNPIFNFFNDLSKMKIPHQY